MSKFTFFIDYDVFLKDGLRSPAGGPGRWLQNLAFILSRDGHQIDIWTPDASKVPYQYPNITFLDCSYGLPKKSYDFCFFNGWSRDAPLVKAKVYLYMEFFRNWEHARPRQIYVLGEENYFICYPFRSSSLLFLDGSNQFRSKSIFLPYPVAEEFSNTENSQKDNWSFSLKEYQFPHKFKQNYLECRSFLEELAKNHKKNIIPFPLGDKSLTEVMDLLKETQFLFPFGPSGSSLEAIFNGAVPFPVFRAESHVEVHLPFGPSTHLAGTFLEYPLDKKRIQLLVEEALFSPVRYRRILDTLRGEFREHTFSESLRVVTETLSDLITKQD